MKNQKGFSLIELLVVVIIIAIIAAIAIPSLLASRRAANEGSAISSLRIYHSAQATWHATTGGTTDYATVVELGDAGLVDRTLGPATVPAAGVQKSGYTFTVTEATGAYCGMAQPITPTGTTATGTREFGVGSGNGGQLVVFGPTVAAASITCSGGGLGGTFSLL